MPSRYIEDQFSKMIGTKDFNLSVNMGQIEGFSVIDKFGINPQITQSTDPEDIWEFGGEYVFDAFGTAPIKYISSSDASDTQLITVSGLDVNGYLVVQEVIANGQNNVVLQTPLWRVFRMENESDEGGDIAGILYCHTDPTPTNGVPADSSVRAIIDNGHNQTLMAMYTIPRGMVGYLYRGELGIKVSGGTSALADYAHFHYESRRCGKIFKIKKAIDCIVGGSSVYQDPRSFPDVIPALTDIRLRVQEVSTTMGVWGAFDILLIDEKHLSDGFLQAIGQCGDLERVTYNVLYDTDNVVYGTDNVIVA